MPWVCLPVGKIRRLAPAALSALIASHPIPAGVACHCTGTRLAWVPDAPDGPAHHPDPPGAPDASTLEVPEPLVAGNWDPGNWGYHGPTWTPPVLFLPTGGTPGSGPGGDGDRGSGHPAPPSTPPSFNPPPSFSTPPSPPAAVPEPSSAALLAVGLAALGGTLARLRRRRS